MSIPQQGACNVYYESLPGDESSIHSFCGIAKGWHAHEQVSIRGYNSYY